MFMKSAIAVIFTLMSISSHAALISTDWKTTNDKLATLDTETGIEWLDLTQTIGKSISTVQSQLDTLYVGWRLPTYDEMKTLAGVLFPVTKNNPDAYYGWTGIQRSEYDTHRVLFGSTGPTNVYGLYQKNGFTNLLGSHDSAVMFFNFQRQTGLTYSSATEAVYLVSDGGTTMSSINNPQLNINNPNAPVNQVAADVSAPLALGVMGLLLLISGSRRKS